MPSRFTRVASAAAAASACLVLGFVGSAVLGRHLAVQPGDSDPASRVLTAIAAAGVLWLPASIWLMLRRGTDRTSSPGSDVAELQAQSQLEAFKVGRRDPLTGLQTRLVFLDTLAIHFARSGSFGVLLIDVDHFNTTNSAYGDGTGDEVLRALADRLRTIAGQREHVARLDGDEFALLLDRADDIRNIEESAMLVLRRLSEPYPASGQLVDLTLSIGIARAPQHGDTTEAVLRGARLALQEAKLAGGATWRICGQDISDELTLRDRFREELSLAIETGQIIPFYQPIVRLPSGEIAKFEVLARWDHPKLGVLTPDRFIPLAEELGLAGHVSMSLLRQVALDLTNMPDWCRFAINVSAGQVRELITFVSNQPGDWQRRMDLTRLDVEITENALLRDRDMARELIDVLHEHGARAGLDNFGSGYSNFFHLRDMPFDSIKIGKSFIMTLLQDPRAEACVMAMLWLGHGLGIDMVADGVETAETAARLAEMGCNFAQGFFYARPVPASDVRSMLKLPDLAQAQRAVV